MYVERAFIYIVPHYFYMFSVFSFRPSMLLILPFRVYEKKSKGKYIRAGGKFLRTGGKKIRAGEKKCANASFFPQKMQADGKKAVYLRANTPNKTMP